MKTNCLMYFFLFLVSVIILFMFSVSFSFLNLVMSIITFFFFVFIAAIFIFLLEKYNRVIALNHYEYLLSLHTIKNIINVVESDVSDELKLKEINVYVRNAQLYFNSENSNRSYFDELIFRIERMLRNNPVNISCNVCSSCIPKIDVNSLFGIISDLIINALKAPLMQNVDKKIIRILIEDISDKRSQKIKVSVQNTGVKLSGFNSLRIFLHLPEIKKFGIGFHNVFLTLEKNDSRLKYTYKNNFSEFSFILSGGEKLLETIFINKNLSHDNSTNLIKENIKILKNDSFLSRDEESIKVTSKPVVFIIDDSAAIQSQWKRKMVDADVTVFAHPFDLYQKCLAGFTLENVDMIIADCIYDICAYQGYESLFLCKIDQYLDEYKFKGKFLISSHYPYDQELIKANFEKYPPCFIPKKFVLYKELNYV